MESGGGRPPDREEPGTGERRYEDIVALATDIGKSRLRYEPGFFSGRVLPLLDGEPDHIVDFVKRVESEQF